MRSLENIKNNTAEKYLEALKELYFLLKHTDKVSLLPFCKAKGLSKNTPYIMQQAGIVENIGAKGRGASYKWTTIEPCLEMAKKLHNQVLDVSNSSIRKSRTNKTFSMKNTLKQIDKSNDIVMRIEHISPEIAKDYMKRNINNRKVDYGIVNYYADQMIRGNWKLSPEGISIDELGRLIDGQHRLLAVIKSNMTISFVVLKGFKEDVFPTVNTGKSRSVGDVFSIEGIPNSTIISSGIKLYINLKKNFNLKITNNRDLHLSNIDLISIYNNDVNLYQDISKKTKSIYSKLRLFTTSEIFSYYIFLIREKKYSIDKIDQFFNQFNTYSQNETINNLRNRLIKDKSTKSSKLKPIHKRALFVKTWNAFILDKNIKSLKYNPEIEVFPELI